MVSSNVLNGLRKEIIWRMNIGCFDKNIARYLIDKIEKAKDNNTAFNILSYATNINLVKNTNDIYYVVDNLV